MQTNVSGTKVTLLLSTLTALLLLAAACSPVIEDGSTSGSSPAVSAAALASYSGSRLLITGSDGNIYTLNPDGTDRRALTSDASDSVQYLQPSWSPDAMQVAWTTALLGDGRPASKLVIADATGGSRTEFDVPFPPFYIDWSPSGTQLAYLSSWANSTGASMALRLVDLTAKSSSEEAVRTLVQGQPLYLSWSPDGERLLTHVENRRIEIQELDGTARTLRSSEATFPAPAWFPGGDRLLYATAEGDEQVLNITDLDGTVQTEITDYRGNISFTLSPDERYIAYAITPPTAGVAAFGPLYTVEIESGSTRQLSETPVLAYFWSPDAQKLAFLAVDADEEDFRLRWNVWDGSQVRDYDAVLPTRTFLERYLAFFDQYAQSMTLWSPDSSAFIYAAVGQDNREGIWVQDLETTSPRYIAPGEFAAWSPR